MKRYYHPPDKEVRIDSFRDGMGRDHFVRMIHLPTGITGEGRHPAVALVAQNEARMDLCKQYTEWLGK